MLCYGVHALRDGTILAGGLLTRRHPQRLAIQGGTGAYAGARGTVTSAETESGSRDTLELVP